MNFYLFSEETLFYVSDELLEKGYVVKDPDEIRKSKAKNVIIVLFLAIVIVLLILLSLK